MSVSLPSPRPASRQVEEQLESVRQQAEAARKARGRRESQPPTPAGSGPDPMTMFPLNRQSTVECHDRLERKPLSLAKKRGRRRAEESGERLLALR